jgi:Asp-tRNA(Asn)/Glu-tRNA(Gln) amidotransferase A subunit family amidase
LASIYRLVDDESLRKESFSVRGAKIAFVKTPVWQLAPPSPGLQAAWEKAKSLLTQHGAVVQEVDQLPEEEDFAKVTGWHENVMVGEGGVAFLGRTFLLLISKI